MTALTLPQALFLLSRDDETGAPRGSYNNYIQMGGAIAELVFQDRVNLREDRRRTIDVVNPAPTGSPFLDMVLDRVASSEPRSIQSWTDKLSRMSGRIETLGQELVALGAVHRRPQKALGLFPITRWPQNAPRPKKALLDGMASMLFDPTAPFDMRTGTVIALANAGHLLKRNFDRAALRAHKPHIRDITRGDWPAAEAAGKAIEAVETILAASAVIVAVSSIG